MLALTIHQPWAWAICARFKPVENRSWAPSPTRCPPGTFIAIHASLTWDAEGALQVARILSMGRPLDRASFPVGAVVGVARFDGVVRDPRHASAADLAWFSGPVGWLLREACPIDPIPCQGSRGLWPLPEETSAWVQARWVRTRREGRRVR